MRKFLLISLAFCLCAVVAQAGDKVVYNSVPNPLPPNVASAGPEANAFSELGDAVQLTVNSGTLKEVTFVMSSWACQSGSWNGGNCVTKGDAKFKQPLTINVYSVNDGLPPTVGSRLGTITETFDVPYRPSSTPDLCPGNTAWYNKKDKTCYHGIAAAYKVNFDNQHIDLPTNGKLIVTVSYNTTHYGPHPIGESAPCYTSSAGCPYDSLNISTDTTDGNYKFVGSPIDPSGIMVNYTLPANSCTGTIATGVLVDDTPCWAGYHPEFQVKVDTK
jgi:hypothetical protein